MRGRLRGAEPGGRKAGPALLRGARDELRGARSERARGRVTQAPTIGGARPASPGSGLPGRGGSRPCAPGRRPQRRYRTKRAPRAARAWGWCPVPCSSGPPGGGPVARGGQQGDAPPRIPVRPSRGRPCRRGQAAPSLGPLASCLVVSLSRGGGRMVRSRPTALWRPRRPTSPAPGPLPGRPAPFRPLAGYRVPDLSRPWPGPTAPACWGTWGPR